MKYTAYDSYAPSVSVWLDKLPAHWDQLRVKHVVDRMESGVSVNSDVSPAGPDEFGVLKTSCVYGDRFVPQENKRVLEEEVDRLACSVKKNRLIISRMNTPELVGSCGYVSHDFPNLFLPDRLWQTVFTSARECSPRFAWYYLTSIPAKSAISSLAAGTSGSMQNIAQDAFMGIGFPLPPFEEQQAISRFLDTKTAKLDELIAKKRQLIDKLKEKRSALIARTVTRGLPPEAAKAAGLEPHPEMRSAEVEWLDEYPCGWSLTPLKHLAEIRYGIGEPPEYVDDGIPLIRATNVDAGFIREKGLVRVNPLDIPAKRIVWLGEGDIIVVRSGAYTADSARIPSAFSGSIAGFDMVVSPRKIESRFLAYSILSRYFKEGQLDIQKMRAAQPHLNAEELGGSVLCVPSAKEQLLIADFLDRETAQIDQLIELAEGVIQSTSEYRQALITSAVTGKIDVRGIA